MRAVNDARLISKPGLCRARSGPDIWNWADIDGLIADF